MSEEEEQARRARAEVRRLTWTFERLTPEQFAANQPWPGASTHAERLEHAELLRRLAYEAAGLEYPQGPTPKHEREGWPGERIG